MPLKRRSDFVVESVVRRNRSALPRAFLSVVDGGWREA